MANQWLRFWHDMPTDPKWRVIAKRCNRPISEVMAVYLFVLVNASCNEVKRGVTQNLFHDDVAAALDLDVLQVTSILEAMQGKVLEEDSVTGWEKRQPKREDSSTKRVEEYRKRNVTQCNARLDKDKDKEKEEVSGILLRSIPPDPPISEKQSEKVLQIPKSAPDWNGDNHAEISPRALVFLSATPRWGLPDDLFETSKSLGWSEEQIFQQIEAFYAYWRHGKGSGKRKSVKGWKQAWLNWLGIAADRKGTYGKAQG